MFYCSKVCTSGNQGSKEALEGEWWVLKVSECFVFLFGNIALRNKDSQTQLTVSVTSHLTNEHRQHGVSPKTRNRTCKALRSPLASLDQPFFSWRLLPTNRTNMKHVPNFLFDPHPSHPALNSWHRRVSLAPAACIREKAPLEFTSSVFWGCFLLQQTGGHQNSAGIHVHQPLGRWFRLLKYLEIHGLFCLYRNTSIKTGSILELNKLN